MNLSDKTKQWKAENAKAFECWNAYVEKNGLPLARFNDLGREPDDTPETVLHLTNEQIPRFVEAAKAGKGLPDDIVNSFMAQLFPSAEVRHD